MTISSSPVASCAHVPRVTCPQYLRTESGTWAHDHLHAYEPLHVLFRCPAAAAPSHAFATILSVYVPWRAQARPRRLSATSRPAWCRVQRMPRLSPHYGCVGRSRHPSPLRASLAPPQRRAKPSRDNVFRVTCARRCRLHVHGWRGCVPSAARAACAAFIAATSIAIDTLSSARGGAHHRAVERLDPARPLIPPPLELCACQDRTNASSSGACAGRQLPRRFATPTNKPASTSSRATVPKATPSRHVVESDTSSVDSDSDMVRRLR